MNKLTVRIENKSGTPLTIFGRNRISIPGSGKIDVVLPDNPHTAALLLRLRREYPFLTVTTGAEQDAKPASGAQTTPVAPAAPESRTQDKALEQASAGKPKAPQKPEASEKGHNDE